MRWCVSWFVRVGAQELVKNLKDDFDAGCGALHPAKNFEDGFASVAQIELLSGAI